MEGNGVNKCKDKVIYWFKLFIKDNKEDPDYSKAKEYLHKLFIQVKASESCAFCGISKDENKLSSCTRCKSTYYCSKECQANHWKEGGHKNECKKV